jgi:Histidine kinase
VTAFVLHGVNSQCLMRATYSGIACYLIGFFGEQRVKLETRLRDLENVGERQASARDRYDGYAQALASVNMRVQACRDKLLKGRPEEMLADVKDLQSGVAQEYDEVRSYIRWTANMDDQGDAVISQEPADQRSGSRSISYPPWTHDSRRHLACALATKNPTRQRNLPRVAPLSAVVAPGW